MHEKWEYDSNGNILSKGIYDYSLNDILENEEIIRYNYNDFNDYLTNYNGEDIVYDSIGNPIIYRNKILCWDQRNLISYDNCSYTYNNHNIRTSKYTGNKKIDYILDGKTILKEIITNYTTYLYLDEALNDLETITETTEEIEYIYSKQGIIGFKYNNELYYYNKNILGDILEIYDSKYDLVAKYEYDAWGNHNIVVNINNIANINPFRYRSYYYDSEANLYYLQSRYYDPQTHRFINMDSIEYLDPENINGLNLFAYCGNNPIVRVDHNGNAWWHWLLGAVAVVALCAVAVGITALTGGTGTLAFAVALGALKGAAIGLGVGAVVGTGIGAVIGGIHALATGGDFWSGVGNGALLGLGIGAFAGAVIGAIAGGIAGGFISESLGESFELGAAIGGIIGSIAGGLAYRSVMSYKLSHMSAYEKGIMGEKYVKALYGNKVYKPTTGANRPDLLFKNGSTLIEVKNVATQGLTSQLNRYLNMGYGTNIIYVRLGTKVSSALKASSYIIKYLPW